ncbi:MAG TPA: hypothetical protein VM600_00550 [Actinomycetota bacterium]|nr:hypothetical protein [Actinomycetota bacterium]
MSTAKKTFYAAIGVGSTALDKARELPQRVIALPATLKTVDVRELPKSAVAFGTSIPQRATKLVEDTRKLTELATDRTQKVLTDLTKRGEKIYKSVQKSAPTTEAKAQTKQAKSKVKAATTSVKKAAEANVEAVQSAVEKTTQAG